MCFFLAAFQTQHRIKLNDQNIQEPGNEYETDIDQQEQLNGCRVIDLGELGTSPLQYEGTGEEVGDDECDSGWVCGGGQEECPPREHHQKCGRYVRTEHVVRERSMQVEG